jgi:hypothetical protein
MYNEYADEDGVIKIKDVGVARTLFRRYWEEGEFRRRNYTKVRNQMEGGLPYTSAALRNRGEAWRTNVNFRDAEEAKNRVIKPYWDMANNVPSKISITVESQSPRSEIWQRDIEQAFDKFHDDWGVDYMINFRLMVEEYIRFGYGLPIFDDKDSPRYKSITADKVHVPKRCPLNPKKWDILMIRDEWTISDLYRCIRKNKNGNAEYAGYNIEEIKRVIEFAAKGSNTTQSDDWVKIQDELKNNDLGYSELQTTVDIVQLLYREEDGSVSHYIFEELGQAEPNNSIQEMKKSDGFIFKSENCFEQFDDYLSPLYYEVGNGLFHGVKGFGIKNYHFSILLNRLKSNVIDSTTISMGLNFVRVDNSNAETPPIEAYGPVNVFPRGLEQLNTYPSGNNGFSALEMLQNNQSEQRSQIANTETAKQAEILASINQEMSQADASLFLTQLSECIYEQQLKRLRKKGNKDEDAKKFVERLKERGVPEEVIYKTEITVKSGANANMASSLARKSTWEQMMATGRQMGFNFRWIQENFIANTFGSQAINKALPVDGMNTDANQTRLAMIENSQMADGVPMPVDPMDMHDKHASSHIGMFQNMMKKLESTGELSQEDMVFMDLCLNHLDGHFEFMEMDETMEGPLKEMRGSMNNLVAAYAGYKRQVEKQMQDAQLEQGGEIAPEPV